MAMHSGCVHVCLEGGHVKELTVIIVAFNKTLQMDLLLNRRVYFGDFFLQLHFILQLVR